MSFCLPQFAKDNFSAALKDGRLTTEALTLMSSEKRSVIFEEYFGRENAKVINTSFEEKLILKSIKTGLKNWEKNVTPEKALTIKEKEAIGRQINAIVKKLESNTLSKIERSDALNKLETLKAKYSETAVTRKKFISHDILSHIEKMESVLKADNIEGFLKDAAEKKLGFSTTFAEAQIIMKGTERIKELRTKVGNTEIGSKERVDYGNMVYDVDKYVKAVIEQGTRKMSAKEWALTPSKWLEDISGTHKSYITAWDFSYLGRQGIKLMAKSPSEWVRVFKTSFKDTVDALKGEDGMRRVHAEMYSHPNFMNGKFQAAKLDVGIAFEEAYPSGILRGLSNAKNAPVRSIGHVYNASEVGFTASALRTRMALMDMYIKMGEKNSLDMMLPENAEPFGTLANSLSGRGNIGRLEFAGNFINLMFFSVRFLKSNIDVLTAPVKWGYGELQYKGGTISRGELLARREAAINTRNLIAGLAVIYTIAEFAGAEVEKDPRSTDFGKIKVGNTRFDPSGGIASIVTLSTRLIPTTHNGQWGWWTKNSKGKYKLVMKLEHGPGGFQIDNVAYGSSALEAFGGFLTNKTAPLLNALVLTPLRGSNFDGTPVTGQSILGNVAGPLPFKTVFDINNPDAAPWLARVLAEELGVSTNTYK
jgi:hypothetical protein